ncbi:MAG: hypothetical protein UT55_C0032G0008 [Candidatus Peregrinibacteria bacterium GW2011_GWE2_39_6]|nr:MAG: hypothetical protein UT36_C0005G0065 [Candidatus Peregrinibacteria bacterium GW2011_GWF2_39_17]KKR25721.1 MAG: hypothetical protein UT55_C0032G0008 [Candidatus Peregrinibacteria bacterium GW2011_GWE2_39_6]HCW32900.1 hypothetical protein [Candidatus Peregrinibacteria bacterium]
MKKTVTILAGFLIAIVAAGCGLSSEPASDAQSSPEKVVSAFYEAFQQSPNNALQFVDETAQKSTDFQDSWESIQTWTFNSVEVTGFSDPWVDVKFEITIEGETESGTDQVEVKEANGKWWIVSIPS